VNVVNASTLQGAVILRQLARCGVRKVVIAPGSRSTPLALAAASMSELECFTLIDERSAGFFALGLSKVDGIPAGLICTSGTAAANFLPAVIEAAQSCVPLVVLTADRPASFRGTGAPQTINQVHLYGTYPRFFSDLLEARAEITHCHRIAEVCAEAFAAAVSGPQGPVHLNVPFDEPVAPVPKDAENTAEAWRAFEREEIPPVSCSAVRRAPADIIVPLTARVKDALCGLIVAGPSAARTDDEADAIITLGKRLGWPILADVLSGLRFRAHPVVPHYDVFLREESLASLAPDVILAFGAHPTSKTLNTYLDRHVAAHTIRVQPHRLGQDPKRRASRFVEANVALFCRDLAERVLSSRDSLLFDPFQRAAMQVRSRIAALSVDKECEAQYVLEAVCALTDGARLVLGNSMPIRYADALIAAQGHTHVAYGMRGANGIDGTISHAAGVAAACGRPALLISGDLAFLHDLSGLLSAARFAPNLTILLLNNDGGGLFHFLLEHEFEASPEFELLHGMPHGLNLSACAELFGVKWHTANTPRDVGDVVADAAAAPVPHVIEVRTSREANHLAYNRLIEHLSRAAAS